MFPIDDDSQFSIYGSIETLTSNSRDDIIVAYYNNLRDKARWPMMVFDENGKVEQCYKNEWALLHGIPLLRIWEKDINENPSGVLKALKERFYIEDKKVLNEENKNKKHRRIKK